MAWVYDDQYIDTDDVVDPRDLMVNVNRYAGEINGRLDRDNIPHRVLVRSKWPTGTFIVTASFPQIGPTVLGVVQPLQTISAAQTGTWLTITDSVNSVTTDDGAVKVTADVNCYWPGTVQAVNDKAEFRLLINGQVAASSGWYTAARTAFVCTLVGTAPTVSGTTNIEVQVRVYAAPFTKIDDMGNGINVPANQLLNPPYSTYDLLIYAVNVLPERRRR